MRRLPCVTLLALVASTAKADNGFLYLGAGISRDKLSNISDLQGRSLYPDLDNTSWKVFAGSRPISLLAIEAEYLDLGGQSKTFLTPLSCLSSNSCATRWHSDAKAFAGYAVGFLPTPLPFLDIYGRAGLARWKLNYSICVTSVRLGAVPGCSDAFSDQGTAFAWGVGAQAHIRKIGGRLEYERFNIRNTNGASVFSLAVFLSLM
jgi:opacity protein-like surface antigen